MAVHGFPENKELVEALKTGNLLATSKDTFGATTRQLARDAFGRQRVAEPATLWDGSFLTDEDDVGWCESSYGTYAHQAGKAYVDIKTTASSDGQAVRQTRQYFTYQPGKSLLILTTGVLETSGGQTDITARIGYYDDGSQKTVDDVKSGDGYFFELAGTSLGVVQRSFVSGSQVDTRVEQGEFNIDTLDGNGPSGMTIDPSKANIFFFEQEWLGVGSVVMGVVSSRSFIPCHIFRHANLLQTPYTSRASLPVRYELLAENTTANVGEMRQICSTVISEGGYTPIGRIYSASRGSTAVTVNNAGDPEVIIAIRKKSAKARVSVNTLNLELISASTALIHFEVWCFQSPASSPLSAESWVSANTNSAVEYSITSASCDTTNGIKLYSGYYSSNGNASFANLASRTILGNNIAGTSDILVITAESLGNNETVYGSASWQESG